jgi:putative drug exporter of the RND superfamily
MLPLQPRLAAKGPKPAQSLFRRTADRLVARHRRVLAAFVFLAAGMIPFASQLSADETHQLDQLLPAGAASVREYAAAAPVTGGGVSATVVLAAPSSGGRVGAAKISRFVSGLRSARIAGVLEVRPPVWVHDRRAALVEVGIAPDQRLLVSAVRQVRALAATVPGTDVGVAGPAAVQSDLLSTFTGAHGRFSE